MSTEELQVRFTYHSPDPSQIQRMADIRAKALELAQFIVANSPASAELTRAINHIEEAIMLVNAAIVRRETQGDVESIN